jgi:hypothetical protein
MSNRSGLTPREFFARRIEGARMVDAQRATGIAYSTIHRIAQGGGGAGDTLTELARWSLANPAAQAAGVYISLDALVAEGAAVDDGPTVDRSGDYAQVDPGPGDGDVPHGGGDTRGGSEVTERPSFPPARAAGARP